MQILVNGRHLSVDEPWRGDSLLHWLREAQGLVGAKYGCGAGQCGACTVLLDGQAVRSCVLPVSAIGERAVTTVEGLSPGIPAQPPTVTPSAPNAAEPALHPVQQAWLDHRVAQCGYCQAGQIMSAVALLRQTPRPTDDEIDQALAGNLCRCGTQHRIRQAVRQAAGGHP